MKVYYVAHPYGGSKTNEKKADKIIRSLCAVYTADCFISPIHGIRIPYRPETYVDDLEYCIALLRKCDGIVMAGDWQNSKGCMVEYFLAKELGKDIMFADKLLGHGLTDAEAEEEDSE